jgi:acetyl esterase
MRGSRSSFLVSFLLPAALLAALPCDGAADLIPSDDSYTVSQRYYDYKEQNPELEWPVLQFQAGQEIMFDRLYKKIGDRELHIDIFLPQAAQRNHQAIMLVHGGGWRSGNKSHFYPMANLLAQRGYTVFLPEYRLSAEARYPDGLVDLNDAIVWVKQQADQHGFNKDKLALGGGSSGGQMAALLAYTADVPLYKSNAADDTRVSALIDLDGVLDFTTPLAIEFENKLGDQSAAGLWFGGAMEKTLEKWQEASAARHVDEFSPPTLIISSGQLRFTAGSEQVRRDLDKHGIRNEYFQYDEVIHTFWLFEPYLSEVVDKIDRFLNPANR